MEQAISKSRDIGTQSIDRQLRVGTLRGSKAVQRRILLVPFSRVMDRKRHFKTNRERKDIVETGLLGAPTESLVANGLRAGRSLFRTGRDAGAYQNADARVSVARTIFYDPHHIARHC